MASLSTNDDPTNRLLRRASRASADSRDLLDRAGALLHHRAALMETYDRLAASVLDAGRAVLSKASGIVKPRS